MKETIQQIKGIKGMNWTLQPLIAIIKSIDNNYVKEKLEDKVSDYITTESQVQHYVNRKVNEEEGLIKVSQALKDINYNSPIYRTTLGDTLMNVSNDKVVSEFAVELEELINSSTKQKEELLEQLDNVSFDNFEMTELIELVDNIEEEELRYAIEDMLQEDYIYTETQQEDYLRNENSSFERMKELFEELDLNQPIHMDSCGYLTNHTFDMVINSIKVIVNNFYE